VAIVDNQAVVYLQRYPANAEIVVRLGRRAKPMPTAWHS